MEKLLQLVEKLKSAIVPDQPVGKMPKAELLSFISESDLLTRMRTFHERVEKGIRSAITEDEDEKLIPSESELQKWRVGKIRKLVREFHKSTQILKKYTKFSAPRLRSHIKRHKYEEMLYGNDLPSIDTDTDEDSPPVKRRRGKGRKKRPKSTFPIKGLGNIIINTGDQPVAEKDKEDCCCKEKKNLLEDQDFFGLIQKLSPNLYNVLAEKAFLLDMCALDRKRMEANVCPIDCRRKAWDEFACCERAGVVYDRSVLPVARRQPYLASGVGIAGASGAKSMGVGPPPSSRLRGGGSGPPPPPPPPPPPSYRIRGGGSGPSPPPPPPPPPPPYIHKWDNPISPPPPYPPSPKYDYFVKSPSPIPIRRRRTPTPPIPGYKSPTPTHRIPTPHPPRSKSPVFPGRKSPTPTHRIPTPIDIPTRKTPVQPTLQTPSPSSVPSPISIGGRQSIPTPVSLPGRQTRSPTFPVRKTRSPVPPIGGRKSWVPPQKHTLPPVPHTISPRLPPPIAGRETRPPPTWVPPQEHTLPPFPHTISPRLPEFVQTGFRPVVKPVPRPVLTRVTGPAVHVRPDPTKMTEEQKKQFDELQRRNAEVAQISKDQNERIRELERIRQSEGRDTRAEIERVIRESNVQLERLRTELLAQNSILQGKIASQKDVQAAQIEAQRAQLQARSDQLVASATQQAGEAEKQRLREQNSRLAEKSREIADLQRRLAEGERDAAQQIANREREYTSAKAQLDKELAVLEVQMSAAQRETQGKVREARDKALFEFKTTFEGKVAGQQQLITSQQAQIGDLQKQLQRASQTGDGGEVARLRAQLDNARRNMEDLQRTVGRLEGGAAAGSPELARLQQERDDLRRQVHEMGAAGASELRAKLAEKDRQIASASATGVSEGQRIERVKANKELAAQGQQLQNAIEKLQAKGVQQQKELLADMERRLAEGVQKRMAFERKSEGELARLRSEHEQRKQEAASAEQYRTGLAASRKELADKHSAWVKEKQTLVMKSSDVDALNTQLKKELETQKAAHLQKVSSVQQIATSSKNAAVKSAVAAAESRHKTIQKNLSDQVKTKDSTIAGMNKNLQVVQDRMLKISQAEVQREKERSELLRQYESQFTKAQAHMYTQVEEIKTLKAQITKLQGTGQIDKQNFLRHMKTANAKETQLQATLDATRQSMEQIRQSTAAQAKTEIDKAHSELSEAKGNFDRWTNEQNAAQLQKQKLLEQQLANQQARAKELAELTDRMHTMTAHLIHQRDPEVLSKVQEIAKDHPNNTLFQSLLTRAQQSMEEEKTAPPAIRLPPGYTVVPDADYETGPTKRKAPEPDVPTLDVAPPAPEEIRGKRRRILDRMQQQFADKANAAIEAKEKAETVTLVSDPATQIQSVQDINDAFNADPRVNIMQIAEQQLGNAVEDDQPKIRAAATKVEAVQLGMTEGNNEVASTIAAIDKLPPDQQQTAFDEASLEARLKLYDAQKRKEELYWAGRTEQTEVPSELAASMEQEAAKREVENRALDKVMQERAHLTKGSTWRLTDEEAAAARSRNIVYLAMAVKEIEVVVQASVPDNNVARQVVVEQTNIVEKAAAEDHRNDVKLPKDKAGPLTKKAIEVVKTADFSNALKFCQLPWWEASSTMLTSRQVEEIKNSKLHGALIQRLVNTQMAKIKNRSKKTLSGVLKKYSLVKNNPDTVTALVQKSELKGLTVAQLKKILEEYKNIIKSASNSEQQTPNYAAAGRLLQIVRDQLTKVEVSKTSQPSRIATRATSDPPRKRMRVKAHARTAEGLAKKPKKTPKRRKRKAKSAKKTPTADAGDVGPPKTALQKWNKHKKSTKMRL